MHVPHTLLVTPHNGCRAMKTYNESFAEEYGLATHIRAFAALEHVTTWINVIVVPAHGASGTIFAR